MAKEEKAGSVTTSFTGDGGRPFGWSYTVGEQGTVEFNIFVQTEEDEQLVDKRIDLLLTYKELAALMHDAQAARNLGMERNAIWQRAQKIANDAKMEAAAIQVAAQG